MLRAFALAAVGVVALWCVTLVGCGKARQKQAGDAGPVVFVHKPLVTDGAVAGATSDETEPNDGVDVATPLALDAIVRARIEPETEVDQFKIDVTAAGALAVEVSAADGVDLVLEIENAGGTVLAKSDRGAAKVREGVPNLGVTPGTYVAVVKSKKPPPPAKKGRKPPIDAGVSGPAPVYEITARVTTPTSNSEREPDDDRGTALDLIVGDAATGYVGWQGDADVWKLSVETLSEKNSIDIEVSAVENLSLAIEIADGIGQPMLTRKAPRGQPLVVRGLVPVVPDGAPPFHYVTIRGDKSNPETGYQLRVVAKVPGPDVEIEPNDTAEKAMAVPTDRTVVHALWAPGDVDFFVLQPDASPRTIDVTIDTPREADLSAELIVDGKVIAKAEHPGKGAIEKLTGVVPPNAKPVIRVRGSDASAEGEYDVQIAEGPGPAP